MRRAVPRVCLVLLLSCLRRTAANDLETVQEFGYSHIWASDEGWFISPSYQEEDWTDSVRRYKYDTLRDCAEKCESRGAEGGVFRHFDRQDLCVCQKKVECLEPKIIVRGGVAFSTKSKPEFCVESFCGIWGRNYGSYCANEDHEIRTPTPTPAPRVNVSLFSTTAATVFSDTYQQVATEVIPTQNPTLMPTKRPTLMPTKPPTLMPTKRPTFMPTLQPTQTPTKTPTALPSVFPTQIPTGVPTWVPSLIPSTVPSVFPSTVPSGIPSTLPSLLPSKVPTDVPTAFPTQTPSALPSSRPSGSPSQSPSHTPSIAPTSIPSFVPSSMPTTVPSSAPSSVPSVQPSKKPSSMPSSEPSSLPSSTPSVQPSSLPSTSPSSAPSVTPSSSPSSAPSSFPSALPSAMPSTSPSQTPSAVPSTSPTSTPLDMKFQMELGVNVPDDDYFLRTTAALNLLHEEEEFRLTNYTKTFLEDHLQSYYNVSRLYVSLAIQEETKVRHLRAARTHRNRKMVQLMLSRSFEGSVTFIELPPSFSETDRERTNDVVTVAQDSFEGVSNAEFVDMLVEEELGNEARGSGIMGYTNSAKVVFEREIDREISRLEGTGFEGKDSSRSRRSWVAVLISVLIAFPIIALCLFYLCKPKEERRIVKTEVVTDTDSAVETAVATEVSHGEHQSKHSSVQATTFDKESPTEVEKEETSNAEGKFNKRSSASSSKVEKRDSDAQASGPKTAQRAVAFQERKPEDVDDKSFLRKVVMRWSQSKQPPSVQAKVPKRSLFDDTTTYDTAPARIIIDDKTADVSHLGPHHPADAKYDQGSESSDDVSYPDDSVFGNSGSYASAQDTVRSGKINELHVLISNGQWSSVHRILHDMTDLASTSSKHKANVEYMLREVDENGRTPLSLACGRKSAPSDIIEDMLSMSPRCASIRDKNKNYPVHHFCHSYRREGQSWQILKLLHDTCPIAVRERNVYGNTPLHVYVEHQCGVNMNRNNLSIAMQILMMNRNAVFATNQEGSLPMHYLGKNPKNRRTEESRIEQDPEAIRTLFARLHEENPSAIRTKNKFGITPLFYVVVNNMDQSIWEDMLKEYPAAALTRTSSGVTLISVFWNIFVSLTARRRYVNLSAEQEYEESERVENNRREMKQIKCYEDIHRKGSPSLRQFWRKMDLLLRVARTGSIERTLPAGENWRVVHAICSIEDCPSDLLRFALHMYGHQAKLADGDGNLPLHLVAATRATVSTRREERNTHDMIKMLLPYGVAERNSRGSFPLHLAVESGKTWHNGVGDIARTYHHGVWIPDPVSGLFPFMTAAAYSYQTNARARPPRSSASHSVDRENERLDTTFELLRMAPGLVGAGDFIAKSSSKSSSDGSSTRRSKREDESQYTKSETSENKTKKRIKPVKNMKTRKQSVPPSKDSQR